MKTIYADFNDFDTDGTLPLTSQGSLESIASLGDELVENEEVMLCDGSLCVRAKVRRASDGFWEAWGHWQFEEVEN